MTCPNCSLKQPKGKDKCPRCGIIFAKWEAFKNQQPTVELRPRPQLANVEKVPRSAFLSSRPAMVVLKILCLLGVIGGWYWFLVPSSGLPIPARAYKDEVNAFALSVPPDWKGEGVKNCSGPKKSCEVFAATRQGSSEPVKQAFNVVILEFKNLSSMFSRGSLFFTESNKDEYAKEALKGIEDVFSSFQMEGAAVIQVDAIPSLRIEGRGIYSGRSLRSVSTLIPGNSKLYLLSYAGLTEDSSDLDGLIQSFRVLERHPSLFNLYGGWWGSLKGDLFLGLLVGLTLTTFRLLVWSKD